MSIYEVWLWRMYDHTGFNEDGRVFGTLEEALAELAEIDLPELSERSGLAMCKEVKMFVDGVEANCYGHEEYDNEGLR